MFAKLLKYEMKSTAGMLGLLSLAALAMGVIGGLLIRYNMNAAYQADTFEILSAVSVAVLPLVFLSLIAYAIGGEIYLAVQFYKHKFTDQGYLTFTLPVRGWQIYLSSLLNMMLWMLIIMAVMAVAFACVFFIGIFDTEIWHRLMELQTDLGYELEMAASEIEGFNPLFIAAEFISSNVLLLTSITLGSVLAKKRKVLGAIGSYYVLTMLIGAVSTWVSGMILDTQNPQMDVFYLVSSLLNLAVAVGGSLFSIWLMDKKLNLP